MPYAGSTRMFKEIFRFLKRVLSEKETTVTKLDPSIPAVKRTIEIVRLFELDQFEVINPALHHYAFRLSDGSVRSPVSIVEIASYIDVLQEHGLYRKAIKQDKPAEIIHFNTTATDTYPNRVPSVLNDEKTESIILPFKQK
jgi:hypothetical protein